MDTMNWKEVPHLFTNGKFKVEVSSKHHEEEVFELIGIEGVALIIYKDTTLTIPSDYCTLIARPISDMSDDELVKCSYRLKVPYVKREKVMFSHDLLYLLSIGVFPEGQFSTEDVIWRYENVSSK